VATRERTETGLYSPMKNAFNRIDVNANRGTSNWTYREKVGRTLWALVAPAFRFSPRLFWGWRRAMLRAFGARVGLEAHIYPSVRISIPWNLALGDGCAVGDRVILYALGSITIEARATISQGAHLCAGTHDITRADRPLLKPPIFISADAWVAAEAFIGPGVTVGNGAIVGARAVVMKDVEQGCVVVGNPARLIKVLSE
jgi:putative colanic acid biosynthesis acetyltransferase WcaF